MRALTPRGKDVDTATPVGSTAFTARAALAQTELGTRRERTTDSVATRRAVGQDLGVRRPRAQPTSTL